MTSTITGTIDLRDIPAELFDPTLELRAAVAYGATVLGSVVLKPASTKDLSFAVPFDPPFLPGARLPCPVRLVIGPNISDLELLSIGSVSGRRYHFAERGARLGVDPRDAPALAAITRLRRLST